MKRKISLLMVGVLAATMLTSCGNHAETTAFINEIDDFCTKIAEINTSINNINAEADSATLKLLGYLDNLNLEFQQFAQLDFPEEYDYLENLADEAGEYMTEAVNSYKAAYSDGYDTDMGDYAKENYSRAYKRIQVIITFLNGDEPKDVTVTTE